MTIREKLEKIIFERELRHAQKRFKKVSEKADRMRMTKREKRTLLKLMFRAAGYKKIRIKELD